MVRIAMGLTKTGLLLLLLTQFAGCATKPLLTTSDKDVAVVLQPISKSNIVDARAEFRQVFCAVNKDHGREFPDYQDCNDALHRLSDEPKAESVYIFDTAFHNKLRIFIIPGIFGECLIDEISPFFYAANHLNQYPDIEVSVLPGIRGRASSSHNSKIIHQYLKKLDKRDNEKLIIFSYSKGTTDILAYLSEDGHSESYRKIDALVSIAGVVNGTPLADDANSILKRLARIFPYEKCPTQDESGIDDLTRENQLQRLSRQKLPEHIKLFSIAAYAEKENISSILKSSYEKLALVDPRNDSQVIYYDAIIPGAYLLGYANADHWAIALPFNRHINSLSVINKNIAKLANKNPYPREVLFESIVRYVDAKLQ